MSVKCLSIWQICGTKHKTRQTQVYQICIQSEWVCLRYIYKTLIRARWENSPFRASFFNFFPSVFFMFVSWREELKDSDLADLRNDLQGEGVRGPKHGFCQIWDSTTTPSLVNVPYTLLHSTAGENSWLGYGHTDTQHYVMLFSRYNHENMHHLLMFMDGEFHIPSQRPLPPPPIDTCIWCFFLLFVHYWLNATYHKNLINPFITDAFGNSNVSKWYLPTK